MNVRVIRQPLAGSPLAEVFMRGEAPDAWYEPRPDGPIAWRARLEEIRSSFAKDWLSRLAPAIAATGEAAERLQAAAEGHGVVVTTGQQPGLFGGPIYTLSKALSALAFANALQEVTGIPVAPVFWAATDDADFKEASSTVIAVSGGAQLLRIDHTESLGRTMDSMPLGEVSAELDALSHSAGSASDRTPLEMLQRYYTPRATIGSAYVSFLRELFDPLGISVIDASHPATREAARPVLKSALEKSREIAEALKARNGEIEAAGFSPQVQDVPGLSLVFNSGPGGRKRIPLKASGGHTTDGEMGPNVLLRPVVERAVLPTAAYLGGPAEIAYFAQIAPIADALGVARPLILPRWSCTILESHVEQILEKLYLLPEDFRDPHEVEGRVARARLPKAVIEELRTTRAMLDERLDALSQAVTREQAPVSPAVTGGLRANLTRRLDRFERRIVAAVKSKHADVMHDIATARGSLYPFGKPQERSLNFVPLLARYGKNLRDQMLEDASSYAKALVSGKKRARASAPRARQSARGNP